VETEQYRISFFRPTTPQALQNRNLIIKLFILWAVGVFGFQTLLKVLEKPVPEEALITFLPAWNKIESGKATDADYAAAGQSMLKVMGKSTLKKPAYDALKDGLGWVLSKVYPEPEIDNLQKDVRHLNGLKEEIETLTDPEYLAAKQLIIAKAAPALAIGEGALLAQILSIGLDDDLASISEANKMMIPGIMSLYLTHNRSVLTDTVFLGFPFHYFYTAVFLLVYFIALCWYYCYRIDKLHARLNFVEAID
jgi:putative solute:sodium symporter small subunit